MSKQYSLLLKIDNNTEITQEKSYIFLFHLQNALLLALRDRGRLTHMQYRHAEEMLRKQRRDLAKRKQGEL